MPDYVLKLCQYTEWLWYNFISCIEPIYHLIIFGACKKFSAYGLNSFYRPKLRWTHFPVRCDYTGGGNSYFWFAKCCPKWAIQLSQKSMCYSVPKTELLPRHSLYKFCTPQSQNKFLQFSPISCLFWFMICAAEMPYIFCSRCKRHIHIWNV